MGNPRRYVVGGAIFLGLVLALIGFFAGDNHTDGAVVMFIGSVTVLASTLIYLLATDDFEARKQIFGPDAADRRDERNPQD